MSNYLGLIDHASAAESEISQIQASACGITSLLNVLITLKLITYNQVTDINWEGCIVRKRANDQPLDSYLASRSIAGCTGQELCSSMEHLIKQNNLQSFNLQCSFISYQEIVELGITPTTFIERSLKEGHCLVATMNLQLIGNDAWHHQMIYGMDLTPEEETGDDGNETHSDDSLSPPLKAEPTTNIYMLNPVSSYPSTMLSSFISTPGVLIVKAEDIIKRHSLPFKNPSFFDLGEWKKMRVREQIGGVVDMRDDIGNDRKYVVIPANYVGGFAVFKVKP